MYDFRQNLRNRKITADEYTLNISLAKAVITFTQL